MPYPPYPSRISNFQQAENAGADISASDLDADLNNLVECLTQTQDVVRGITTASGTLKNQSQATAQALAGAQRFVATASQTVFDTSITYVAAFTNLNVMVESQGTRIDSSLVTVANNAGSLRVTIPSQTVGNVVIVSAFESGAGLTTNLASTSAGKGASLIGVQDSGALYAATNAEAALAEVMTKINTLTTNIGTIADIIKRTGSVAFTGNQSMGNNKLTNLANGTASTDAVNVSQLQAASGDLVALEASVILRDGTQAPTANVSWGGFKITNLATPTSGTDAATMAYAQSLAVPSGTGGLWFTSVAPSGWLLCDGSAVSRTTYSALFALFGTTYGAGDGTTTFNLPDFRGRSPLGAGTGNQKNASGTGAISGGTAMTARALGAWGGEETHTQTTAELAAHSHTLGYTSTGGSGSVSESNAGGSITTSTTGSSSPMNWLHPFLVVNIIVKT